MEKPEKRFLSAKPANLRTAAIAVVAAALAMLAVCLVPSQVCAQDLIDVKIESEPALPGLVAAELKDIFTDTLTSVLFEGEERDGILGSDPDVVAEAIRTGINIVIEPKGYTVAHLDLEFQSTPVTAVFAVHPEGWTAEDPHAVTGVDVELDRGELGDFWMQRFSRRLAENEPRLLEVYRRFLVGLPSNPIDRQWAVGIVMAALEEADPLPNVFPDFRIERSIELGAVAKITVTLEPEKDLIELIRPRMYSSTLYNVILDRMRERLLAEADFMVGMPRSEIEGAADEIAGVLSEAIEEDAMAKQLRANASISVETLESQPIVRIDAVVDSNLCDLWLETFVDFGNESRDSSEVQSRMGVLLTRGVEVFVNLNYFTNDSTLQTDVALGFRPVRGTFAAVGYDLDRKAMKYFVEQEISPGFRLRGEIFEDDSLNEFGMTYQFQQYLSAGIYTNGDNEYWVRSIFAL